MLEMPIFFAAASFDAADEDQFLPRARHGNVENAKLLGEQFVQTAFGDYAPSECRDFDRIIFVHAIRSGSEFLMREQ